LSRKGLANEPEDRFPTSGELAEATLAALRNEAG
jgi:hypothetical protein